jgi:hypothetical protein
MESIERIAPIAPTNSSLTLHVAETNKDGKQKPGGHEEPRPEAHDVLELHTAEGEEVVEEPVESHEPPTIGLDLAV